MGVKDLWSVLTPYAERKPICELRGKIVAIDLAGWVCESLNVVDYFVHPRHHLKNLFFRTCYLIWEEVTPVFVLEGEAPKLKSQIIAKRNELQFRGVKPKEKSAAATASQADKVKEKSNDKGRTRFNHVLKQCENLLKSMGIQCVQGPGEAEAYCAFLNKRGLVDGVISQDSDCFAYGAFRVYRNFSVSTQGAQAAQGGAVDIYDMREICRQMDFGQHKVIVMALLCGCDYCPDGIGGVGRDSVLKLFNKYKEEVILHRIRSWRKENDKYTALEMRVDDKSICSNCGHMGRTQSHTKQGCGVCRTHRGCDESLWKEERLSLKSELMLRKKALADAAFPSEDIIAEFLHDPDQLPTLHLSWHQPNIVKFIKQIGNLLQWSEIYCFQKFFPILTRWQVRNAQANNMESSSKLMAYVKPKEIIKKRTVKGVPSLELLWQDEQGFFEGLIPIEQIHEYEQENPKGLQELWITIEPMQLLEKAYPQLVQTFLKSKEKPKKTKTSRANKKQLLPLGALENLADLKAETSELLPKPKRVAKKIQPTAGQQCIDRFLKQPKAEKPTLLTSCSTPKTKHIPSDLDSECDESYLDLSNIVNGIVQHAPHINLSKHAGQRLLYESMTQNLSHLLQQQPSFDDMDVLIEKRRLSISQKELHKDNKVMSFDDSFDAMVHKGSSRLKHLMEHSAQLDTHVKRFKKRESTNARFSMHANTAEATATTTKSFTDIGNVSYFFNHSVQLEVNDAFEKLMEASFSKQHALPSNSDQEDDDVIILM